MTVETIERNGFIGRIEQEEDAESPRDLDNLGTIVTWHRNYSFGDRDGVREHLDPAEFTAELERSGALVLPVYLYDHSGLSVSTGPFGDPWDSGQVGVIYVDPDKVRSEYSVKRITKKVRATALECLRGEVSTLDQYLTGDVYGYVVEDSEGEHVDSCWGFFGLDYARSELESSLDNLPYTLPLPE